ncbi:MAG TPA: S8 family serine peptidase, partial [Anaerolineae bacterium]|nr:S8 family serine peptidase [Anaerolineae bacterium]
GFQWILAPGGDPSRAPDVLSNSWGSDDGYDQAFEDDVRALNAAGIDTYFSNGNAGSAGGSVGSPASYPESFGVGAVDDTELIASFSSRGPSPWGELKPQVVAPGIAIWSSIPGGGYLKLNGTSMAAPQAAGIAALMRSAVPGLTITQTRYALTTTAAHNVSVTYPNNDYGWGRVDAFSAVVSVLHSGSISGTVRRSDTGAPVPFATMQAASRLGTWNNVTADEAGRYTIYGATSLYTLTVSAFGYVSQALINVPIMADTITVRDVDVTPLPLGWVSGRITDLTGTQSISASLDVLNTPVTITAFGAYSLALPGGTYVLRAQAAAYRIVTAEVTITAGETVTQNFALPDAPRILLVDSGRWYNGSVIPYYRQALDDLNYRYDEWPIRDLNVDLPTTRTLRAYNVVIWSAPFDSPGLIGSGYVISDFLGTGGRLLLSGQDVGYYDDWQYYESYYHAQLMARMVADDAASRQLIGLYSFDGLTPTISGPGGADNQFYPDVIASQMPTLTETIFNYDPIEMGGQSVGLCRPYRAVYLSFGFEAINDRSTRAEVLSRTFGQFERPLQRNIFTLDPIPDQLIAPPGALVTHTVMLNSFDEVAPLTFTLSTQSAWNVTVTPAQMSLKSCEAHPVTITVHIPPAAVRDASAAITLTAQSIMTPSLVTSTVLIAKAPASVLLVQDDRWYPVDAAYRSALSANGISYDLWRVPTSWVGFEPAAPSADRLSWYPQVVWFTGYDWYQTLTPSNTQTLQTYLRQGGRLLLSSQDFLSADGMDDFKHNTLGVLSATIDLTSSLISGVYGGLFDGLIQQPLNFPYTNYDDALTPQPGTQVALVGDHGWPVALAHDMGISKTLFMAFGFEGFPTAVQPEVMNRAVGFLSRLGRSSLTTDRV